MRPTDSDLGFMQEAIALAWHSLRCGGGPFGAVVVSDGKIIGRGHNRVTLDCDPTAHAEVNAIREACAHSRRFHLDGAVLYTSCMPCPMCLSAAYWARISHLCYAATIDEAAAIGFADAFIYAELAQPPEQRQLPLQQLAHAEGLAVFDAWRAKTDRSDY